MNRSRHRSACLACRAVDRANILTGRSGPSHCANQPILLRPTGADGDADFGSSGIRRDGDPMTAFIHSKRAVARERAFRPEGDETGNGSLPCSDRTVLRKGGDCAGPVETKSAALESSAGGQAGVAA